MKSFKEFNSLNEGQMVGSEIDAMKKLFSTMQTQLLNMPSNQRIIQMLSLIHI